MLSDNSHKPIPPSENESSLDVQTQSTKKNEICKENIYVVVEKKSSKSKTVLQVNTSKNESSMDFKAQSTEKNEICNENIDVAVKKKSSESKTDPKVNILLAFALFFIVLFLIISILYFPDYI